MMKNSFFEEDWFIFLIFRDKSRIHIFKDLENTANFSYLLFKLIQNIKI